jgi:tetratricopeptide (TPR) repeat protein
MADVFAMQADIAGRVAGAMNVALAGGTRARLAEVPTRDPAAYDAYLRGKAITKTDPVDLRRRLGYFQQAVALDSTFLLAWAERARVAAILYSNGVPNPALAREAKAAAERAIALEPQNGIGYGAFATYRNLVEQDPAAALALAEKARALSPGDPELLRPLAIAERQQGRMKEALQYMREAVQRDPRNAITVHLLADALLWARRYDESRDAADRALALAPDVSEMIENRAMVSLAQGDLTEGRRVLAAVPSSVDRAALAAAVAMYYDLPWLLDDADQRRLLALGPAAFDDDRMSWGWALSQTYTLRGDAARARQYADTALVAVDEQLRSAPNDAQRQLVRALVLATLGRSAEALTAGEHGMALARRTWTATNGPYLQHQLARVYLLVGQKPKALDQLEPLLRMPYYLSPAWLRIDPTFATLRSEPRFERLTTSTPVVLGR